MPLPLSGPVAVRAGEAPRPAYLIRFNEETWAALLEAHQSSSMVSLSVGDQMTLNIPSLPPIALETHTTSNTSEIHSLASSPFTLNLSAQAGARLSIPFSSSSSAKAADKLKMQTEAIDKERQERANRLNGIDKARSKPIASLAVSSASGAPMGRAISSPPVTNGYGNGAGGGGGPMIPLKTRVVQLLALGAFTAEGIVGRVGGAEAEVMRVVKVVGRQTSSQPTAYTLQPSQYSKIKIGLWKYTYIEKQTVIRLARAAFDELGLPSDAEERVELDRKEVETSNSASSSGSSTEEKPPYTPEQILIPSPPQTSPPSRITAPVPRKAKVDKKSLIGKQKAKFAAEKRASSLPNVKAMATKADAMPSRTHSEAAETPKSMVNGKRKRTTENDSTTAIAETIKDEGDRGRTRSLKSVASESSDPPSSKLKAPRTSRDYSSSSSSSEEPLKARISPPKRKSPPPAISLHYLSPPPVIVSIATSSAPPARSEESLRDRYEELFPAYQQLTTKLRRLHEAAEGKNSESAKATLNQGELGKMVTKWGKWHKELEAIRRWFCE